MPPGAAGCSANAQEGYDRSRRAEALPQRSGAAAEPAATVRGCGTRGTGPRRCSAAERKAGSRGSAAAAAASQSGGPAKAEP